MSPELTALTLAALLQVVQFGLMSVAANRDLGPAKTLSPRDASRLGGSLADQLGKTSGRLYRAMNNHFEALILFTIACVVTKLADASSPLSAACAYIYVIARVLYVPAYAFGWVPWRSLIWFVGFGATTIMLILLLLHFAK